MVNIQITPTNTTQVVSLAKAKKHLRLDPTFTEEDDIIQDYIDAAVSMAEAYTGLNINEKQITFSLSKFDNPFVFEYFPVKQVLSVAYCPESADVLQVLPDTAYRLLNETEKRSALHFKGDLPLLNSSYKDAVQVQILVGLTTVDKAIAQAVLLIVADLYERREDRSEVLSTAAMALLRKYKKF